jgi:hypothetical protein
MSWTVRDAACAAVFALAFAASCKTAEFGMRKFDLNGMVYDFENRPVSGYEVSIDGKKAVTDVTGRFSFAGMTTGMHALKGAKGGFESFSGDIDARDAESIAYIRIASERQLLDLACAALDDGDAPKASGLVARAEGTGHASSDCRFLRAIVLFRMGDADGARSTLDALIADGCEDPYVGRMRDDLDGRTGAER